MNHITPSNPLDIYKIDDYVPFVMKAEAIEPGEPAQLLEYNSEVYGLTLFINIHPLNVVHQSEEEGVEVRRLIVRVLEDIYVPYIANNFNVVLESIEEALDHYLAQCHQVVSVLEMTSSNPS